MALYKACLDAMKLMDQENSSGLMEKFIKEISKSLNFMEMAKFITQIKM